MERLTERFSNGQAASYWCGSNCQYDHKYCRENVENCPALDAILEKLAHFEDLQEAGRLVELPCKLGDYFYDISEFVDGCGCPEMYMFKARNIELMSDKNGEIYFCIDGNDYKKEDFGKIVFPTCEEAEAALEGGDLNE